MSPAPKKILFIDRDGTLVEEPDDNQVDAISKIRLVRGVIPALLELRDVGYRFVMVTNQDGLGTASFPQRDFDICQEYLLELLRSQGIQFERIFVCPHLPDDQCECRKPRTGLLTKYLAMNSIDADASAVIGDRETDLHLAENLGLRGFRVDSMSGDAASWQSIKAALVSRERTASVNRTTRETAISLSVFLDDASPVDIRTGIGFLDHMLEQIARHGDFGLHVHCSGDLDVDEHHTVEDIAICLGTALREALGDKRGIGRYGFLLPMDESEAKVSLDLSGRAAFVFDADFNREFVGGLPTELVAHFFQSLAESLGAALHLAVTGSNNHHMIEACFKGVGRALRQGIRIENQALPSTKGVLA